MRSDDLDAPTREVLAELAGSDALRRLYERDPTLWGPAASAAEGPAERLGWLDTASPPPEWPVRLEQFARQCRRDGVGRVVLCGMGGSAFAPLVLAAVVDPVAARFTMLDSTHPDAVRALLSCPLDDALVVVASKSGTTVETVAMAEYAVAQVPSASHLAAVTDPGTVLEQRARAEGWREVFLNPPDIGGRFSALSLFGMVPAAVAGLPVASLWERAAAASRRCSPDVALEGNPAAQIAAFMVAHARAGRDKLTLLLDDRLATLGLWVEQMVAESTGKDGTGVVPVIGEPTGVPSDYGDDRAFVEVRLGGRPAPAAAALAGAGRPLLVLDVDEPLDVAGALFEWMAATALAGALLGINPFDQPDVGSAKEATARVLEEIAAGAALPEVESASIGEAVAPVRPGDYLAVEAYLEPTEAAWRGLRDLQGALRTATGCAVTANFGPRYLHSTGQLHKGGPEGCVVVQLLDEPADEPIPGREYGFATLLRAQAAGDLRALRARGRRALQVTVGSGGLAGLVEAVRAPRS